MSLSFYGNRILASSFLLAMSMVAIEVSLSAGIFCAALMFWKWGVEKYGWIPLSRWWTSVLSVLSLVMVLVQFRTLIGQEASYTFLLSLAALRVMDYRTPRDHKFVVLLGFLLVTIKFLFSLDIYWLFPAGLAFAGLWYSLLPPKLPSRGRVLLRLFLLSAPLTVLLFFAFPRYVMPWAMSRGGGLQGEIGFSDELNPGKVAELAGNNVMAFRARLDNIPLLVNSDLYWRGSVLSQSKGLSWSPGRPGLISTLENYTDLPSYNVAIEPTSNRFLFSLEGTRVVRSEFGTVLSLEHELFRSSRPISKAMVYVGYWDGKYQDETPPVDGERQVPPLRGRVRQWVDNVLSKNLDEAGRIKELQKFFSQEGFVYSLRPGTYGANDLEEFLFERRKGFCEHYAGAYASLARGLGIPARVIVGYQGGRYNPWGDFWKVSQKDAHAWVEVFLDGKWVRRDPTTWVAPLRLTIGAEDFFKLSEEEQINFAKSASWRPSGGSMIEVWDQITLWAEDLNYQWTYFLIDFDRASQKSFWEDILQHKGSLTAMLISTGVFIYALSRNVWRRRRKLSPEEKLLQKIERWGGARNIIRQSDEPPLSYFRRLAETFPQVEALLSRIVEAYDQRVYAGTEEFVDAKKILREWNREIKKGP